MRMRVIPTPNRIVSVFCGRVIFSFDRPDTRETALDIMDSAKERVFRKMDFFRCRRVKAVGYTANAAVYNVFGAY